MVYLGDDIRSKFNHETLQLNFDFGSTRKALHTKRILSETSLIKSETFNL